MADLRCITRASRLLSETLRFVRRRARDPFVHAESIESTSPIAPDLTVVFF
jgi:hypothetical protein